MVATHDTTYRIRQSASRRIEGATSTVVRLGEYVTFITRAILAIPYTLVHYRRRPQSDLRGHLRFQVAAVGRWHAGHRAGDVAGGGDDAGRRNLPWPAAGRYDVAVRNAVGGGQYRELAPVVVAIALAAKVGTGFTAQIGAMRISDEIAAGRRGHPLHPVSGDHPDDRGNGVRAPHLHDRSALEATSRPASSWSGTTANLQAPTTTSSI